MSVAKGRTQKLQLERRGGWAAIVPDRTWCAGIFSQKVGEAEDRVVLLRIRVRRNVLKSSHCEMLARRLYRLAECKVRELNHRRMEKSKGCSSESLSSS